MQDENTAPEFDEPSFSRGGLSGPFGKFDFAHIKAHLDEHTYNIVLQKCARMEKQPGVLARDFWYLFAHGGTVAEVAAKLDSQLFATEGTNEGLLGKLRNIGVATS